MLNRIPFVMTLFWSIFFFKFIIFQYHVTICNTFFMKSRYFYYNVWYDISCHVIIVLYLMYRVSCYSIHIHIVLDAISYDTSCLAIHAYVYVLFSNSSYVDLSYHVSLFTCRSPCNIDESGHTNTKTASARARSTNGNSSIPIQLKVKQHNFISNC